MCWLKDTRASHRIVSTVVSSPLLGEDSGKAEQLLVLQSSTDTFPRSLPPPLILPRSLPSAVPLLLTLPPHLLPQRCLAVTHKPLTLPGSQTFQGPPSFLAHNLFCHHHKFNSAAQKVLRGKNGIS